jgi:hypothetical protein
MPSSLRNLGVAISLRKSALEKPLVPTLPVSADAAHEEKKSNEIIISLFRISLIHS